MERTYESAAALAGRATGPLTGHHALAFDRWLAEGGVPLADLGEVHVARYQHRSRRRHQRICTETWRRECNHITQLLQFLRGRGVCRVARIENTAADELAARYEQHLRDQQGLATTTIKRCRTITGRFLHERFGRDVVDLSALCASDVIAFVQRRAKCLQPPALKCITTAMRSFLRYARYCGEVATALDAAVPVVAAWTTTPAVPKAIVPAHAQSAIDSCDLSTCAIGPCCCFSHVWAFALTRSLRCSWKTAAGTAASCECAARVDVNSCYRYPPMWALPSRSTCSRGGRRVRIDIYSCNRRRRSAN
jgi:integrase/recombinase XerD